MKIQLLNDGLWEYAFKRSTENYNELKAKNINVDFLRQAFVYSYTEQGTLFWQQKEWEYEQATFTELSVKNLVKGKWYCDIDDIDEMEIFQFSHSDKNYIYFKSTEDLKYYGKNNNGLIPFSINLKFYSYEFKKQG